MVRNSHKGVSRPVGSAWLDLGQFFTHGIVGIILRKILGVDASSRLSPFHVLVSCLERVYIHI